MFDDAVYGILNELAPPPPPMPDLLRGKQPQGGPQVPPMQQPPAMLPQAYPPNPVPQQPLNPPQQQAMAQPQAQPRPIPQATPPQQQPQAQALPQAVAASAGGTDWGSRIRDVQSRLDAAQADEQAALQPIDRSAMESMYKQRAASGSGHLVRALAAIEAGKEFQPIAQHYLKASEEAEAPMKMAGGTMTKEGFIEDPGYAQDLKLKRAQARVQSIEKALEFNLTAQQREDLQREKLRAEAELKRQHDETLRAIAASKGGGEAGTWSQAAVDPDTKAPIFHNSKTNALVTYNAQGQPVPYTKGVVAKGQGGDEKVTEGERKAGTLLQRLQGSQAQLAQALLEDPSAAKPSPLAKTLAAIPKVGPDAANMATSPARQRVEAAQLDILDAALTLGTGAAYTREQLEGYRRSYFPQIGDDTKTVADKKVRLDNVIKAAHIAAGPAGAKVTAPQGTWDDGKPSAGGGKVVDYNDLPK